MCRRQLTEKLGDKIKVTDETCFTGRALKWDWVMQASKLDLRPPREEFGDLPMRPVAVPGQTPLI